MADCHAPNPDAAELPPDDVRQAFLSALKEDSEGVETAGRIADRAAMILEDRALAPDAQGFAVALVAWAASDVLPLLDARAIDLPPVSSWEGLGELQGELAPLVRELGHAWSQAYRTAPHKDDSGRDEYAVYAAFEHVAQAVGTLRRIPKYRLTDPNWKAKRPRPTPLSLCIETAHQVGWCLSSALDAAPDAEGALDRLGLARADMDVADRAARARRALAAIGFGKPGARLVEFADIVAGVVAVSPGTDPRELAERALDAAPDSAERIAGEDPALAARPLVRAATSVSDAARAVLIEVGAELAQQLAAATPERRAEALAHSQPTPVSTSALPSPADLAARLVRSVEQNRRTPRAALAELRKLDLSDEDAGRVLGRDRRGGAARGGDLRQGARSGAAGGRRGRRAAAAGGARPRALGNASLAV